MGEPPEPAGRGPGPERFRLIVSAVLGVGVSLSAVLVAAGLLSALAVGWQGSLLGADPGTGPTTDFGGLWGGLRELRPLAIAQLGLIVLIATPVVRVATTLVVFVLEGDRLYVAITAIVLGILAASLFAVR